MGEVEYTVTFVLDATTVGEVKFDPAGMTVDEVVARVQSEAVTRHGLCHECGRGHDLGDVQEAVEIYADGQLLWEHVPDKPHTRLLGVTQIGELFGVQARTVHQWMGRYRDTHPVPVPDFEEPQLMWWSGRVEEWKAWKASTPGQGAGGGRPPKEPAA